jgi:uncharacterized protein (DUF934 family)
MRRIIRRREIVEDALRYAAELAPGEHAPAGTIAVRSLAEHLSAVESSAPVAVLLGAADEVEALAPHLSSVRWIVIEFAKIGEGRGYSQARALRTRYRYRYELRARGAIKRDQLFFLARCGFDAFDLDAAENLEAALAAFETFSVAYQDGSEAVTAPRRRAEIALPRAFDA